MGRKKKKKGYCYYCGEVATSYEHVPPKGLRDRKKPIKKVITVPSCDEHNSSYSKDDEYLRFVLLSGAGDDSLAFSEPFKRMMRGFNRKPALLRSVLGRSKPVNLRTESGIYVGQGREFEMDTNRFNRIFDKITRGLFYYHFNQRLSGDYFIDKSLFMDSKHHQYMDYVPKEFKNRIGSIPLHICQKDVFEYRYIVSPQDEYTTYWFFMFYKYFLITSRTIKKPS